MKTPRMNSLKAFTLIALGLAIAAMGIYVVDADDAPGAAAIGMLLMVVGRSDRFETWSEVRGRAERFQFRYWGAHSGEPCANLCE
jgi:hypothetical protein